MAPAGAKRQALLFQQDNGGTLLLSSLVCCQPCRITGCDSRPLATRRLLQRAELFRNFLFRRAECPAARSISPPLLLLRRSEMPGNYWCPSRLQSPGCVILTLLGAGVVNREAAVGAGSQHEIVPQLGTLRIGYIFCSRVVLRRALLGVMKLPERLQAGGLKHLLDHLR